MVRPNAFFVVPLLFAWVSGVSQNAWADDLEDDEEEDMGMGVSNTIKNRRKTPDPKYVSSLRGRWLLCGWVEGWRGRQDNLSFFVIVVVLTPAVCARATLLRRGILKEESHAEIEICGGGREGDGERKRERKRAGGREWERERDR